MTDGPLLLTVADRVAMLTLNRPKAANALELGLAQALSAAVASLEQGVADETVGAVLVQGAGAHFCAGGDLRAMLAAENRHDFLVDLAGSLEASFRALSALGVPVIAAVHGSVAGAGLALMLSCDIVVAADDSVFLPAYPAVGLTTDCGVAWLLPRAVGEQRALSFLLRNRRIDAATALSWGLVGEVVATADLDDVTIGLAASLAHGPTFALGSTKRLVRDSAEQTRAESGAAETAAVATASDHPQSQALIAAFNRR